MLSLRFVLFSLLITTCTYSQAGFIKGVDISFLQQMEKAGVQYRENGQSKDAVALFKNNGVTYVRLRLWHTPADTMQSMKQVIALARRAKLAGLEILLDLHYSDTWADPANQSKPAAWQSVSYPALKDSVYQYTKRVITAFAAAGCKLGIVQVGNEISCGFLWNTGSICGANNTPAQWQQFAGLLNSAISAVRSQQSTGDSIMIMIHSDKGSDSAATAWFYGNLAAYGVLYDYIGLSYYPWWQGQLTALQTNVTMLAARFGKPVFIVETAYPWTLNWCDNTHNNVGSESQLLPGYPATPAGQEAFLRSVISILQNIPNNLGRGVFYWAPDWLCAPSFGSSWENLALFDFSGNALPALAALQHVSGVDKKPLLSATPQLLQNFPNHFNPVTILSYYLPATSPVLLRVYTVQGQLAATLVDAVQPPGNYSVSFDASHLSSGIYLYTLTAGGFTSSKKMILLK